MDKCTFVSVVFADPDPDPDSVFLCWQLEFWTVYTGRRQQRVRPQSLMVARKTGAATRQQRDLSAVAVHHG